MINIIWSIFIISGIVFSFFTGRMDIINSTILDSCKTSLNMVLEIFPVISLWMGIMQIASDSSLLNRFSMLIYPILRKLFPDIPRGDESLGFIASNIIANIFGLGSAATPFGLKAMNALQKLNKKKDTASNSMITFLVLNTSGLTLIPTTVISLRIMYHSINPSQIILTSLIATTVASVTGLTIDYLIRRRHNDN